MKTIKPILLLGIFVALMFGVNSCGSKNNTDSSSTSETEKKDQLVKVAIIESKKIDKTANFSTVLEANEQVFLVPSMPGKINKINVEVGARVSKGQTLVEMDQTNLYNARVQLTTLKTEFNRMKILLESGSVSQQAYDQVKAQYDVAKANVDNLERNTYIRAPFSGIISGKYFEEGEMYSGTPSVQGKAAIVSLVQISNLKAMINVPETYYPILKQGTSVQFKSELYPNKDIVGKIVRIYPTIDATSHTFQIEVSIPNAKEELKPGMYCSANLKLGQVEAVLVSSQVVLKTQGSNERYVFINENGKAKQVFVQLGERVNDMVEIISADIKIGDQLVVEGQGRLVSGDKLKIAK